MNSRIKKIGQTVFIISILSILGKISGFFREIVLSYYYGADTVADAYIMSGNIVGIIFGWLTTIYFCFTPVYQDVRKQKDPYAEKDFISTIITFFLLLSIVGIIFTYAFNEQLVRIVAPGFDSSAVRLTSDFLKIASLILLVEPFIYTLKPFLECNEKFINSSLADMIASFCQLTIIVISGVVNYRILPFSCFLPYVFQMIILWMSARKVGFRFSPRLVWTKDIQQLLWLVIPYFFSGLITELNSFVDRYFASSLSIGSVALVNYAGMLNSFMLNVFIQAIATMIYPKLAVAVASKDGNNVNRISESGVLLVLSLFIPLSVGGYVLSDNIVSCVYGSGSFDIRNINVISNVFQMYMISLVFMAVRELLLRILYSFKNMKYPLVVGMATSLINIVLNTVWVRKYGAVGLALSTSVSTIVVVPILFLIVYIRYVKFDLYRMLICSIKIMVVSAIMVWTVKFFNIWLMERNINKWLGLISCVSVGAGIYLALLIFLMKDELKKLITKET